MKYKITRRLIFYFSIVLLLFSAIVGILFWILFTKHTAKIHEQELKNRAISIADTLSEFSQAQCDGDGNGKGGGYGAYLRFIDDIAMSEVWLVDEQAQIIQTGHKESSLSYSELPSEAENLIQHVFQGKVETNKEFSSLLGTTSITVGAPIFDIKGNVNAALLLHSSIGGIGQAQQDGFLILIFCIFAAMILAAGLSVLLVQHFIEPLKTMAIVTSQIMEENYNIQTGITQNDEIGLLAYNIDKLSLKLSELDKERKKLDKMRQDFVSNISHELRTPVTVIKGSLEVLDKCLITNPQEIQEYIHQMLIDTVYLQRLVNDLLELSRLQNTDFKIEKNKINLTDVLIEVIHSMKQVSEQKQIKIILVNKIGAVAFWGDYGRLRQMFTIILDNAIKFSPTNETIEIKIQNIKNICIISISDNGIGISQEYIPYIFERFYKERSELNKNGSGLGLSIAKEIAQRHDVIIQCSSEPNKGTCFSFQFKLNI